MKKLDIRSILIGVLCTALVFVLIGAKSQNENLGDIVVNSIKVLDDGTGGFLKTYNADGIQTSYLGTGEEGIGFLKVMNEGNITTYNADGIQTSYLGTGEGGIGFISTYNADGIKTSYLGTAVEGSGKLQTYNKHEVLVGYFGSNTDGDGTAVLYDCYGDIGWGVDGKQ
jgi:hypothetical protein